MEMLPNEEAPLNIGEAEEEPEPVRSAVLEPQAGQLVVWRVTTCESWLLYVFGFTYLTSLLFTP